MPAVGRHGISGEQAFLELEYLDLRSLDRSSATTLGRQLAALHRHSGEGFGWPADNFIGLGAQPNGWMDSWPRFFAERRLRPQLALARSSGADRFDPACYYGDREADIAMSELFGGFPESFYAAYREAWPLDAGYETRKTLYNLYHILNHFNIFGAGYLGQARRMIARLQAELRG